MNTSRFRFAAAVAATALCLAAAGTHEAAAQTPLGKRVGLGVGLGEPTALTLRARTGRATAVDVGVGASAFGTPRVHVMYTWQFTTSFGTPFVNWYAGLGVMAGFDKKGEYYLAKKTADPSLWFVTSEVLGAARGSVGLNWFPRYTPLEIFAEMNPIVGLYPKTGIGVEGWVGIRIYP